MCLRACLPPLMGVGYALLLLGMSVALNHCFVHDDTHACRYLFITILLYFCGSSCFNALDLEEIRTRDVARDVNSYSRWVEQSVELEHIREKLVYLKSPVFQRVSKSQSLNQLSLCLPPVS